MLRSTERNENNFTVTCEILIFVKCSKSNKGLEVSPIIMKQLKMVPSMEARRHVAVSFVLLMGVYLSSAFLMCASASGGDLNEAKVSCEVQRLGKKCP